MPDIHDMELDARPSDQELYDCSHKNTTYQAQERDTNVSEGISCDDCGKELELSDFEPDEDTMRGEDRWQLQPKTTQKGDICQLV